MVMMDPCLYICAHSSSEPSGSRVALSPHCRSDEIFCEQTERQTGQSVSQCAIRLCFCWKLNVSCTDYIYFYHQL